MLSIVKFGELSERESYRCRAAQQALSFGFDLPLSGAPGIESRTGGATNDHAIVLTFSGDVTVNGNPQAAVTSGMGTVGSEGMSNGGMVLVNGNVVTVPLTNVANAQTINVTLFNVNNGSTSGNVTVPMSVLVGDANESGAVNSSRCASLIPAFFSSSTAHFWRS